MRSLSFLIALTTTSFAGEIKPYVLANGGLTIPKTNLDVGHRTTLEENIGYSFTFGLGVRLPVNPQIDLDGSIRYSLVSGGITLKETSTYQDYEYNPSTYTSNYYTVKETNNEEVTVSPKLIDLEADILLHVSPSIAVGGGIVFSIPVGGSYESSTHYTRTSDCPSTATSCVPSESDGDGKKGDLNTLFDDADIQPKSFASFKFQGEYLLNDHLSVTGAWLLPIGDYIHEDGNTVSWSRAELGVKYAFSLPNRSSANSVAMAPPTLGTTASR